MENSGKFPIQFSTDGERSRNVETCYVTAEHQGNYTCHAQNIVGKTLETIQLIGEYVGCQYEYVSNSSTLLTN